MKENPIRSLPGIPYLFGVLVLLALAVWGFIVGIGPDPDNGIQSGWLILGSVLVSVAALLTLLGLYMVEPNQAAVVSLMSGEGRVGKGCVRPCRIRWVSVHEKK